MDKQAILLGKSLRNKPDLDWLAYENQTHEWSVRTCEAFERHLIKLKKGWPDRFWYGKPQLGINLGKYGKSRL